MKLEKIAYRGWPNCYRLTNYNVDLVVTTDVGPRVIRYGFVDGPNMFYECEAQLGNTGEPWWMIRGGHRLWVAPEIVPETYALDNSPVEATFPAEDTICVSGPIEAETKLRKEMTITLFADGRVRITHKVTNCGPHTVRWAPWPATLLAPGGTAFAAFPTGPTQERNFHPTHPLVMWASTDFSDPRWIFTRKHLILKQDPEATTEQKAGLFNTDTFAAYLLDTTVFAKQSEAYLGVPYADFHCSCQMFTNRDFMELETLGPFTDIEPETSISHVERWSLLRNVQIAAWTDDELDRVRALIS
ncbi:MAG TPA: hypothetical protein VH351_12480 [Bryobacteraceae bacterium]|jgi:hypothetical protein|nr:hypothetical protein [Bryobacteraceae bacterium]